VYPAKLFFLIEGEINPSVINKNKGIYDHQVSIAEDM
jgi:hypothetical protein